jgi:thiamine-phosphate pyrophosphorylase
VPSVFKIFDFPRTLEVSLLHYTDHLLLYYITDRTAFPGDEPTRRRRLLHKISEAAAAGVDYIQLREKDLPTRDLESLANETMQIISGESRLLINSRADIALAAGADGVHLRSQDISPQEVREIWKCDAGTPARDLSPRDPLMSISCHSPEDVAQAAANQATFAVFAPVFEKKDSRGSPPTGLQSLREACRTKIPVLALGGINIQNAKLCLSAGAAGIAAIRLFQENDIATVVRQLRNS